MEDVKSLDKFTAPFNQQIELLEVTFEGDTKLLRLRIKEGKRFTIFDMDVETAERWGKGMMDWATSSK
ncbi:MAG: hypothetical protein OQJ97_03675 [Rhodospirillales bacterium]|nr:hypothetical protein [Rhodospirillales bacterium]